MSLLSIAVPGIKFLLFPFVLSLLEYNCWEHLASSCALNFLCLNGAIPALPTVLSQFFWLYVDTKQSPLLLKGSRLLFSAFSVCRLYDSDTLRLLPSPKSVSTDFFHIFLCVCVRVLVLLLVLLCDRLYLFCPFNIMHFRITLSDHESTSLYSPFPRYLFPSNTWMLCKDHWLQCSRRQTKIKPWNRVVGSASSLLTPPVCMNIVNNSAKLSSSQSLLI